MEYIITYKVAQSFNIGLDINDETTKWYTEAVINALTSGHALFEECSEYPITPHHIITEHEPDSKTFFTYLDFRINSNIPIATDTPEGLDNLRERIVNALSDGRFELVILWRRNLEAHIVFEYKKASSRL